MHVAKSVLVTGAGGFIGSHLCKYLATRGFHVTGTSRSAASPSSQCFLGFDLVQVGDMSRCSDWSSLLKLSSNHGVGSEGVVDYVIHCAALAHVLRENRRNALDIYRRNNVHATLRLASQAAQLGVKRFIFLSSIGVNGSATSLVNPFAAGNIPKPDNPYSVSKLEAEILLGEISSSTDMDVVIVRPPLVYGAGSKGNLSRLVELIKRGAPMPFASIRNKRAFISLDNLSDFLIHCMLHPAASNQTFLISDGFDVSTPYLINSIALSLGVPPHLFPFPEYALRSLGLLLGRSRDVQRLVDSLLVDISGSRELLEWTPPLTFEEGISRLASD